MTGATLQVTAAGRMGGAFAGHSRQSGYDRMDLSFYEGPDGVLGLHVAGIYEPVLQIVPADVQEEMWRIRYRDGRLSDLANLERIKDAACSAALAMLNTRYANRSVA